MRFWNKAETSNDIYIYGDIVNSKWDESEVTAKEFTDDLKRCKNGEVTVHVNSSGGDVFNALAIYNTLKAYKGNVTISIEGLAASAASIIICAGDVVQMAANAQLMIHMPSVGLMGYYDAAELEKVRNALVAVEGSILETYKSRLPKKNHAQVAAMMLAESWINATDAKELGFIDEITDAIEITDKAEDKKMGEEIKVDNELMIANAVKQAREQELTRIKNLMALRGENAAVNAIIDTALGEGAEVSEVAKYIDAVKSVKVEVPKVENVAIDAITAAIRDNLKSGGEEVGGSMPATPAEDTKMVTAKRLAEIANSLRGVKRG